MGEKNTKEFKFGNEKFGGRFKQGEIKLNLPDELSPEEFENMFAERLGALYKFGREIIPFDEENIADKKEKLKPFSIRIRSQTKDFFKNNSILSAREVLELYEDYNHGSEAFINSLLREEKELEYQLAEIQEKLHNARLFKDKLQDMNINGEKLSDEEVLANLEKEYEDAEIKILFEGSADKILNDIQLYNTQSIALKDTHLEIVTANNIIPVVYFFSSELSEGELIEALTEVKSYAEENQIEFVEDGE